VQPAQNVVNQQIAYVTNDFDRAMKLFADDYGVSSFFVFTNLQAFFTFPDPPEQSPNSPRIRVGLATVNGIDVELIQPLEASPNIYGALLPSDGRFAIVHHHIGLRITGPVSNWDAYRATMDERTPRIVVDFKVGDDLNVIYTDERVQLGHYIEHFWMSPKLYDCMVRALPRFPAKTTP
jgi:Glyoxalase/Bleomycin resistance protein/Dioxygenase superfamily